MRCPRTLKGKGEPIELFRPVQIERLGGDSSDFQEKIEKLRAFTESYLLFFRGGDI